MDFMGEIGMKFTDKVISLSEKKIENLNRIYEEIWEELMNEKG